MRSRSGVSLEEQSPFAGAVFVGADALLFSGLLPLQQLQLAHLGQVFLLGAGLHLVDHGGHQHAGREQGRDYEVGHQVAVAGVHPHGEDAHCISSDRDAPSSEGHGLGVASLDDSVHVGHFGESAEGRTDRHDESQDGLGEYLDGKERHHEAVDADRGGDDGVFQKVPILEDQVQKHVNLDQDDGVLQVRQDAVVVHVVVQSHYGEAKYLHEHSLDVDAPGRLPLLHLQDLRHLEEQAGPDGEHAERVGDHVQPAGLVDHRRLRHLCCIIRNDEAGFYLNAQYLCRYFLRNLNTRSNYYNFKYKKGK